MSDKIRVIVCEAGKPPYEKEIENDYKTLQAEVGGRISMPSYNDELDMVCADDVDFENTPPNRRAGGQLIYGTFLIVRNNDEGETISLTNEDIAKCAVEMANFIPLEKEFQEKTAIDDITLYTEPLVKISFSESQHFETDEVLTFTEADLKFKEVERTTRQELAEQDMLGCYDKTFGTIHYKENPTDTELSTYEFRYDIGDYTEKDSGLLNHIKSFWTHAKERLDSGKDIGVLASYDDVKNATKMIELLNDCQDTSFIPTSTHTSEKPSSNKRNKGGGER